MKFPTTLANAVHEFHSPLGRFTIVTRQWNLVALYLPGSDVDRLNREWEARGDGEALPIEPPGAAHVSPVYFVEQFLGGIARGRYPERLVTQIYMDCWEKPARAVYEALRAIPLGERRCYEAIAASLPKRHKLTAKLVARICQTNPLPIIIPCHRAVQSERAFGGYVGPHGKRTKERLANWETQLLASTKPVPPPPNLFGP